MLRKQFPQCKIGGGTDAFFAELNRFRTPPGKIDFLIFSIAPTVHASDLRTITETLVAEKDAALSCMEFAKGKEVHAGPVTFKMRWSPHETSATNGSPDGTVPANVDPLQLSLYGAAWTLGSTKYLSKSQVSAISFYQTCGWGGVIPDPAEAWPAEYKANDVVFYPLYFKGSITTKESFNCTTVKY